MAVTKQDVINYVMNTPHNTNKAVLSSILNQYAVSDNKTEIELSATENKVYTPAEGKVYNKVTVNVPVPEGGDFSIVSGSFNSDGNVSGHGITISGMVILENDDIWGLTEDSPNNKDYSVVLYKGQTIITLNEFESGDVASISGGIEFIEDNDYLITGDFTVHYIDGGMI